MENIFGSCSNCEVVEDQGKIAPAVSGQTPPTQIACPSVATSMPDLMPVVQWCDDYHQQRPSSASQAATDMFPVEKDMWGQASGGCRRRQRSEEDDSWEGPLKRRKH